MIMFSIIFLFVILLKWEKIYLSFDENSNLKNLSVIS